MKLGITLMYILISMLIASFVCAEEVYHWKDEKGVMRTTTGSQLRRKRYASPREAFNLMPDAEFKVFVDNNNFPEVGYAYGKDGKLERIIPSENEYRQIQRENAFRQRLREEESENRQRQQDNDFRQRLSEDQQRLREAENDIRQRRWQEENDDRQRKLERDVKQIKDRIGY